MEEAEDEQPSNRGELVSLLEKASKEIRRIEEAL